MKLALTELKPGMQLKTSVTLPSTSILEQGTILSTADIIKLEISGIDFVDVCTGELANDLFNNLSSIVHNFEERIVTKYKTSFAYFLQALETSYSVRLKLQEIYEHSVNTYNHSVNTMLLSLAIGLWFEFTQEEMIMLGLGALLHDIGKVFIPNTILDKDGKLNNEELSLMQSHTQIGYDYLKKCGFLEPIALIALQHHERYDGTGYPRGIGKRAITQYSRIVHVADVFDALCIKRSYKIPYLPSQALSALCREKGTSFDPLTVEATIQSFHNLVLCYRG